MAFHQVKTSLSSEEFFRHLSDSCLLSQDDLTKHTAVLSDFENGQAAVQYLVDTNVLTEYQAEAIVEGRFEQLVLGNYVILSKLGSGGMGAVFKARHRRMKRIVAVKVLSSDIARQSSFVKRFQREVETIAQLTHPNIVMAFDADEAEIGHFLVMEYVEGRDLASEIQQNGPLSVQAAVDAIAQAASGMAYAHSKGIIHRDIKPANLMLTNLAVVKVADLGLARITGIGDGRDSANFSLTQAGGILGTVDYMPPEQSLDSTAIDHRADIYSLGCTMFFLLTGKPPYAAGSLMGLMLQHRDAPIPSLSAVRHDVPRALVSLFEQMIAKQPSDRPQSMDDVIRLLDALKPQVQHLTSRPLTPAGKPSAASTNDMTLDVGNASSLISTRTAAYAPTESQFLSEAIIVLVEPSRTQNAIVRGYLTKLGISQIHTTVSGAQALTLTKEKHAHAVISTMHLSDMTGVQLVQGLRSDPSTAHVGFVLMTSESDTSLTQDLLKDPLTIVLIKPFDLNRLAQSITATTNRTA
jgi:serine/threonine protein kinase